MSNIVALKKPQPETLRKIDVVIRVEGQTSDDSVMSGLVVGAVKDFIHKAPTSVEGKFESRGGLDVSWRALNRYYEDGILVYLRGVDSDGRRYAAPERGSDAENVAEYCKLPVPIEIAHTNADRDELVILGVRYSRSFFENFAQPDPDKAYRFARRGDQVVIEEVPLDEAPQSQIVVPN